MDDFVVGRKAIIDLLRGPLDLSQNPKTAWHKIMRWRKYQGMDGIFHADITGRPFVIITEVKEWLLSTDRQRVRKEYPKGSKDMVPQNEANSQ